MCGYKKIVLQVSANIENYEIELCGNCDCARKRVFTRDATFCVCTDAPYLRLIATPLNSDYNTKLYFTVDVACNAVFPFYFRFSREQAPTPTPPTNTFTLTDASYGLPIDGSLLFTSV